ncbi:hypothetical protein ACA910_019757 [Epithemia clementina (nom. ined.)]
MLYKALDFVCTLLFAEDLWPMVTEYEPLTLAFTFPMLNRTPWRVRRSDICVKQDDSVQSLHGQHLPFVKDYLQEFWIKARALGSMLSGNIRAMLSGLSQARSIPTRVSADIN